MLTSQPLVVATGCGFTPGSRLLPLRLTVGSRPSTHACAPSGPAVQRGGAGRFTLLWRRVKRMHEARCGGQGLRRDRLRTIDPRLVARRSFFGRALLTAFALAGAATVPAGAADAAARPVPRTPGVAPLPRVTSPRLYVIDCGTLVYNRPEDYNLTREEVADTNMSVPCFLVIHAKGILLFDTGLSDRLVGRPLYENVDGGYAG